MFTVLRQRNPVPVRDSGLIKPDFQEAKPAIERPLLWNIQFTLAAQNFAVISSN
jgi:hypothetical protein